MKIAILGAGMSGLISAHALAQLKIKDVVLYDKNDLDNLSTVKEFSLGAFYLHKSCGLNLDKIIIHYIILGATGNYAHDDYCYQMKVYKKTYKEKFNDNGRICYVVGYDVISAKQQLLSMYGRNIKTKQLLTKKKIANLLDSYDYVISTLPLPFLFSEKEFPHVYTYATNIPIFNLNMLENYTIFNLNEKTKWYRTTKLFGVCSTEYIIPITNSKKILKVISHSNKLDFPKRFISTGRWGKWEFQWTIDNTYEEILQKFGGVK